MSRGGSNDQLPETAEAVWQLARTESIEKAAHRIADALDSQLFAAEVLNIGSAAVQGSQDTLQDLHFRITVGQTPIVHHETLPEGIQTAVRKYEGNRRRACLKALEEAWGSDWQEHLPLPKTAVGLSKLRELAKLAAACPDFEQAKEYIDQEITQSGSDQSEQSDGEACALVSRAQIGNVIKTILEEAEEETRRLQAEAAQQKEQELLKKQQMEEKERLERRNRPAEERVRTKADGPNWPSYRGEEFVEARGSGSRALSTSPEQIESPEEDAVVLIKNKNSRAPAKAPADKTQPVKRTKKGKEPAQSKPLESLWERRPEHAAYDPPAAINFHADRDAGCQRLTDEWEKAMRKALAEYMEHPYDSTYRTELDDVCKANPTGMAGAYSVLQAGLPERDWFLHTLPFTVKELLEANAEALIPSFHDLAKDKRHGQLSAMDQLMGTIETISDNTILQSADGQYLALYCKAGMSALESDWTHAAVTKFLKNRADANICLTNPKDLPEWGDAGDAGEVHLAFDKELSPHLLSEPLGFRAAVTFLEELEPLTSKVTNIIRLLCPGIYKHQRSSLNELEKVRPDLRSILGPSQGIHTGFRLLKNLQQPPSITPFEQTFMVNMSVMTAFQEGSGTGGHFLIGTKYYQYKFNPARGSLLFFRGDLLYHAVARYEPDEEEAGHTTLILEPCDLTILNPPTSSYPPIDDLTKPLPDDLLALLG